MLASLRGLTEKADSTDPACAAQDEPIQIREAVFILEHFVDDKALYRKIARHAQVAGLAEHDLGHAVIELCAEIAEGRVLLMLI